MTTHYIAMAGLSGYLPNLCESHESYESAVGSLVSTHELGRKRAAILKRNGYIDLNISRDGNEYAEITDCECDTPEVHSDN